jgi:tripartite ATP-independent transporter DctP family solute receptor
MLAGRASAQAVRLVLSHHVPTAHIIHTHSEKFAAYVAEATKGQVTIDIRPASQLFNLRTSAEAVQLGTLDMCWSDLSTMGNWKPEFGFVSQPFLFTDYDHVKKVLQGPVGEQVSKDLLAGLNVETIALSASGFRVFFGRKAISKADDCKGIKLRVPEIQTWVEMARALGANPTPIPAGEIYTALQTGVVDAIEVPPDFITSSKLYEVGQHATKTYHIFTEVSMFGSAARLSKLSPEIRKAIWDSARRAILVEKWEANLKEQQDAWADLARRVTAVQQPDVASFRTATKSVTENFIKRAGPKAQAYIEATQKLA